MNSGKVLILNYCRQYSEDNITHIQNALHIKFCLENDKLEGLDGHCPSAYGLDNYVGDCEINGSENSDCRLCWKRALNIIIYKKDDN